MTESQPPRSAFLDELAGCCRVLREPAERLAYARDAWPLGHLGHAAGDPERLGRRPLAVACPAGEEEVSAALACCHRHGVAVVPWGEGSGVCGGTLTGPDAIALDLKALDRVEDIDSESLTVRVQCGINGRVLEQTLERSGLTLGHSPSSILCSTLGGWLAARSAGQFSTRYGKIEDMVLSLRVVLADGEICETVTAPRSATGPDWNQIFVGSEGTLGVIVAATLRVWRLPERRAFLSVEMANLEAALGAMRELLQQGIRPAALRLYDPLDTLLVGAGHDHAPVEGDPEEAPVGPDWPLSGLGLGGLNRFVSKLPGAAGKLGKSLALRAPGLANRVADAWAGACLMIVAFEGTRRLVDAELLEARRILIEAGGGKDLGPERAETWYRNRHAVSFKQSEVFRMGAFSDTMEVATTWSRLPALYDAVRAALAPHALVLAHFSHAYAEGCSIYFTMAARCASPEEAIERYHTLWKAGLDAVVDQGAAVSHHHGIGVLKAAAFKRSLGPLHARLEALKSALDPRWILNPGKLGLEPPGDAADERGASETTTRRAAVKDAPEPQESP